LEAEKAMPQPEISRYTANLIECLQMYDALFDRFYNTLSDRYGKCNADSIVKEIYAKEITGFRRTIEEYLVYSLR
jgi:hypothetical protein